MFLVLVTYLWISEIDLFLEIGVIYISGPP